MLKKEDEVLKQLGVRLKNARLEWDTPQKEFASQIGVSVPTLRKMETGSPQVAIGTWVKALATTGHLDDLDQLLKPRKSLAKRFESYQKTHGRERVKRSE